MKKGDIEEYNLWVSSQAQYPHFAPTRWAGVDCASFVNRVINAADGGPAGVKTTVISLTNDLFSYDRYAATCETDAQTGRVKSYLPRAWVEYYFVKPTEPDAGQRTYYLEIPRAPRGTTLTPEQESERARKLKLLRKGDLIQYPASSRISHVSIFYSDRASCANQSSNSCTYEIMHAYGGDNYKKIVNGAEERIFSRKVLITPNDISTTISNPSGFGRIKLWD